MLCRATFVGNSVLSFTTSKLNEAVYASWFDLGFSLRPLVLFSPSMSASLPTSLPLASPSSLNSSPSLFLNHHHLSKTSLPLHLFLCPRCKTYPNLQPLHAYGIEGITLETTPSPFSYTAFHFLTFLPSPGLFSEQGSSSRLQRCPVWHFGANPLSILSTAT